MQKQTTAVAPCEVDARTSAFVRYKVPSDVLGRKFRLTGRSRSQPLFIEGIIVGVIVNNDHLVFTTSVCSQNGLTILVRPMFQGDKWSAYTTAATRPVEIQQELIQASIEFF